MISSSLADCWCACLCAYQSLRICISTCITYASLSPRVGSVEHGPQPFLGDVSVTLRRGHVRMTEELLDDTQVSAPVEQVGGEGVAQSVRVGGCRGTAVDDAAGVPGSE